MVNLLITKLPCHIKRTDRRKVQQISKQLNNGVLYKKLIISKKSCSGELRVNQVV